MALSRLDKIGFVSTEIFHFIHKRTNVAWTNVDVTNVLKTVENSCRWPNHQTFKVFGTEIFFDPKFVVPIFFLDPYYYFGQK